MKEIKNNRRLTIPAESIEISPVGYANGISTHLQDLIDKGEHRSLNETEKEQIINKAAKHFNDFLIALGVNFTDDPNSMETGRRVAKSYVNDLWKGRYNLMDDITSFPTDGYDGCITQTNIDLESMCSHHHLSIRGRVHVSYIPGEGENNRVIGLSKINRVVEHFGRRGAIQEQLTEAISNAICKICEGNLGVAVMIVADHGCVACRGIGHKNSTMVTTKLTGVYKDKLEVRNEFFKSIELADWE